MMELLVSLCVRAMVGVWEYSGAGVSPMFGDFEAQRHWLEITTNIDIGALKLIVQEDSNVFRARDSSIRPPPTSMLQTSLSHSLGPSALLLSPSTSCCPPFPPLATPHPPPSTPSHLLPPSRSTSSTRDLLSLLLHLHPTQRNFKYRLNTGPLSSVLTIPLSLIASLSPYFILLPLYSSPSFPSFPN
jgi:hypothetical protein